MKKYYLLFLIAFTLFSCKKETNQACDLSSALNANLTEAQQQELLREVSKKTVPTTEISAEERAFFSDIRIIANDIPSLYNGVTNDMTLEEKYEQLKHNIRSKANEVEAKALVHYNGSVAYTTMAKNSFVLMTYDALQRNVPEMMWTNLGIFAANEVRGGVVLASQIVNYLEKNNIKIPLKDSTQNVGQMLTDATVLLLEGQLNVVVDIGALVLLNKYVDRDLDSEFAWLTPEAIKGFKFQKQAEQALRCGQKEAYQDLQTLAAIQFGIHEQTYILQPLWDKPLLGLMSQLNEMVLKMTNGQYGIFGEIFIGANKYTEPQKGYNIKIPKGSYNLVNIVHRVDIAMNGFNTYNRLRKDKNWSHWIDYSQIRLGYGVDVYYGTPMGME